MKIQAQVVADSLNPQGDRLTSLLVTFPRFILAELNTHRILSKNSASSRAIPTHKLLKMVEENPFIPIAWQKEHKGMQGTEYFTAPLYINTQKGNWLKARDHAVVQATYMRESGVTKQLCNRLLEPFMWHTVLISGTEWENFFSLRCPQYFIPDVDDNPDLHNKLFKSKKDLINTLSKTTYGNYEGSIDQFKSMDIVDQLIYNKGQAEIHMMALAEVMWDVMNESTPKQLQAGEWHIPFGDKISIGGIASAMSDYSKPLHEIMSENYLDYLVKISTAMAARTSYTVVGDEKEVSYERLVSIHDKMAIQVPFHASPFEHCAKAMGNSEYLSFVKGELEVDEFINEDDTKEGFTAFYEGQNCSNNSTGWCRNYRGFIQYRHILEQNK